MEAYRRLTEAGRIEFVTFHQSFAYEDFVEGLRPVQESDGGSASFELRPVPGVFRKIAHRAATSRAPAEAAYSIEGRQVFKMSIGEASNPEDDDLFDTAINQGFTRLNWDVVDWSDERFASRDEMAKELSLRDDKEVKPEGDRVRMQDEFRSGMRVGDLIIVSKGNSRFRAIGAVKGGYQFDKGAEAYAHKRAVQWLWVDPEGTDCKEIIDRWFSMKSIYRLPQGSLNVAALERVIGSQQSVGGPPQPFVLIIDEINRANVSKVFGELITLLEPDKRLGAANEVRVRLPYSGDLFGVPSNLHVVGTMNTADRSIALLDTALRRRFTFRELMPQPELLGAVDGIGLQALLTVLNQRIEYLFDREHQIGHAYFMGCQTRAGLDDVMRHKVIPLLAEYFFEDWGKVAAVLGDASEEEGSRAGSFLDRTQLPAPKGLGADAAPRYRWSVRPDFDYANLL